LGGRAVLVGAPCRQVEASLSLPQAYALSRSQEPDLPFGGVLIPERHEATGTEDARIWTKMQHGCRFFVSQTVWSVAATRRLLSDLRLRCELAGVEPPPVLLTFSPCGSRQTLEFLEWLGVAVPKPLERELLAATDMLARSVELAVEAFAEVRDFAEKQGLAVGCNVESLTARAAEVEASLELLQRIDRLERRLHRSGDASEPRFQSLAG
jgi:5,10-methylenetetrahydrofolate reductase